jgi:hypothetical protein
MSKYDYSGKAVGVIKKKLNNQLNQENQKKINWKNQTEKKTELTN